MLTESQGRGITATMDTATVAVSAPGAASNAAILASGTKYIKYYYRGSHLTTLAGSGNSVNLTIEVNALQGFGANGVIVSDISVNAVSFGVNTPIALRNGAAYRYGFNGMERDDEISGSGNHTTAEHWAYDTRLGRRWNVDPIVKPWESSYATFSNNPIMFIDESGKDAVGYLIKNKDAPSTLIIKSTYYTNNVISQETQNLVHQKLNMVKSGTVQFMGEKVNVQFQIEFKSIPLNMDPNNIAGAGYSDDFNEGNNTFEYSTDAELNASSVDALGAGNRRGIEVLDRTSGNPTLEAKIIVEEIGHNIGFLHKDEGIMNETLDEDGYSTGNMTRKSLQSFVNRLEGMTNSKSSSDYWKNSKEATPCEETTGTTRVKEEN